LEFCDLNINIEFLDLVLQLYHPTKFIG